MMKPIATAVFATTMLAASLAVAAQPFGRATLDPISVLFILAVGFSIAFFISESKPSIGRYVLGFLVGWLGGWFGGGIGGVFVIGMIDDILLDGRLITTYDGAGNYVALAMIAGFWWALFSSVAGVYFGRRKALKRVVSFAKLQ